MYILFVGVVEIKQAEKERKSVIIDFYQSNGCVSVCDDSLSSFLSVDGSARYV